MPSPISPKPMIPTFNKLAPRRFGPAHAEPSLFCHNSYHELGFVSKQTTDILTALADPLGPRGGHMEQVSVSGQVAILTGGARGIGRAACRLFAERGASVVVNDIKPEHADAPAVANTYTKRQPSPDVAPVTSAVSPLRSCNAYGSG